MDRQEALRTFTTGENFHLQHYLGFIKMKLMDKAAIHFVYGRQMLKVCI